MPPTVNATAGHASANSFATAVRITELLDERLYTSAWVALSPADKDRSIIQGTRILARRCYRGSKTTASGSLPFPRTGLTRDDGSVVDPNTIPLELELALAEVANLLASGDVTAANEAVGQGLARLKAGPVELEWRDDVTYESLPASVKAFLPEDWFCPTRSAPSMEVF